MLWNEINHSCKKYDRTLDRYWTSSPAKLKIQIQDNRVPVQSRFGWLIFGNHVLYTLPYSLTFSQSKWTVAARQHQAGRFLAGRRENMRKSIREVTLVGCTVQVPTTRMATFSRPFQVTFRSDGWLTPPPGVPRRPRAIELGVMKWKKE